MSAESEPEECEAMTDEEKRYRNTKIMFVLLVCVFLILIVVAWAALLEEKHLNKKIDELGCRAWLEERINYNYQEHFNVSDRFFPVIVVNTT